MDGFIVVSGLNILRIEGLSFDRIFKHHITDNSPGMKPHTIVGMKWDI
jgi:hypothetical protein